MALITALAVLCVVLATISYRLMGSLKWVLTLEIKANTEQIAQINESLQKYTESFKLINAEVVSGMIQKMRYEVTFRDNSIPAELMSVLIGKADVNNVQCHLIREEAD